MTSLQSIRADLKKVANPTRAKHSISFFKTGKGEYAEGDIFMGVRVPDTRKIVRKHSNVADESILQLLKSPIHEERLIALLFWVREYQAASTTAARRTKITKLYLKHKKHINNWDLVDVSAPHILGAHCFATNAKPLYNLSASKNLWSRRLSIVSTHYFIRNKSFHHTLKISEILLNDKHDLIHKAAGWMLREVGKKDVKTLQTYLKKHAHHMPRTMLRYAIEKFSAKERLKYLSASE